MQAALTKLSKAKSKFNLKPCITKFIKNSYNLKILIKDTQFLTNSNNTEVTLIS